MMDDPIRNFFVNLREIFFHPIRFFQTTARTHTLSWALSLGVLSHWIFSGVAKLTNEAANGFLASLFSKSMELGGGMLSKFPFLNEAQSFMVRWFFGVAGVLIDPIFQIFWLMISTTLLWLSARLLLSGRSVPFETLLKISAYALCASPLMILPFVGSLAYGLYWFGLAVIGLRETLEITTSKAMWIRILPDLAVIFAFFFAAIAVIALFTGFFALH